MLHLDLHDAYADVTPSVSDLDPAITPPRTAVPRAMDQTTVLEPMSGDETSEDSGESSDGDGDVSLGVGATVASDLDSE